jgi:hypothetical protein
MDPTQPTPRTNLGDFIEMHSKLVTSIAAFVALTAFSSQIDNNNDIKPFLTALPLLAAVILILELHSKLPFDSSHWRLTLFSHVLTLLTFAIGWYWVSRFPVLWVPIVGYGLQMCIFLGGALLLTHLLTKAVTTISAPLFKRSIAPIAMLRISQTSLVLFAFVLLAVLVWTSHKLSSHPVTLHIPTVAKSP